MSTGWTTTGRRPMATPILITRMVAWSNSPMLARTHTMYDVLCSPENLFTAFLKARKDKTKRHYVQVFEKELDKNLKQLAYELRTQIYRPKPLTTFVVRDPKTRKISKSRFRDRIVHHALINVIGPILEKQFIYDSHANQFGKGTLKAVQRFDLFKRKVSRNNTRPCYVLKADIKHYFEEVDHAILLALINKHVKDSQVMWLVQQILANTPHLEVKRTLERRERERESNVGMPLGNHTSQFFANVYLNELDQFVKHVLKAKYYIRYVDDFVVLSSSHTFLVECKKRIDTFLREKLRLRLHPEKSHILSLASGVPFLGYRIFYHHKILRKRKVRAFERKFKACRTLYHEKQLSRDEIVEKLQGWLAYAEKANTYSYRRSVLRRFNRFFPFKIEQKRLSKAARTFYKKVAVSKLEFSTQKTLALWKKGISVPNIALQRGIKEGTVWEHLASLIEFGWISAWNILSRKKMLEIMPRIRYGDEKLTLIKSRMKNPSATFDEIACVRAHIRYKEKIKKWMRRTKGRMRPSGIEPDPPRWQRDVLTDILWPHNLNSL